MHKVLIFLHIPKCGGTTINRALRMRILSPWEILREIICPKIMAKKQLPDYGKDADRPSIWRNFKGWSCFMDRHSAYGMHEFVHNPYGYLTVFRKPESWVVSAYHFSRRHDEPDISLEEFVRQGRKSDRFYPTFTDNIMVRMISGERGRPSAVPIGQCTREMLETAKKRIDENFLSTMILERLDESMLCLCLRMGWRKLHYITSNVNKSAARKKPITAEQLQLIRDYNKLDIELYEYANHKLDQEINKYGGEFPGMLKQYQKRNQQFAKCMGWLNRAFSMLRNNQIRTPRQ